MGMVALSSKNSIIVTLEIFKKPNPNFRRVIMITNAKDFYASIQGKRVAFLRHRREQPAVDLYFSEEGRRSAGLR